MSSNQYVATRAFPTTARQYEMGDMIDTSRVTSSELNAGVASGAVIPARFTDTAARLAATNPILGPGVRAYETDTGVMKIGTDGITAYTSLSEVGASTFLSQSDAGNTYARRANNLSDLASIPTARAHLGVSGAAEPLTVGCSTIERRLATTASAFTSGQVRLVYFTPGSSFTAGSIRMSTGGTAAGATPTLIRIGIWLVEANGDLTLVCSTANDTSLFSSPNIVYSRAISAPVALTAAVRYAFGILVVSATTMPTIAGCSVAGGLSSELFAAPREAALLAGQTDLPSSISQASLGFSGQSFYAAIGI